MSRQRILAGLDVGTSKICALIASTTDDSTFEVKGLGLVPSHGLKKGLVIDIDEILLNSVFIPGFNHLPINHVPEVF